MKNGQLFFSPEDAQRSETNANTIFRFLKFLVLEIWLILYMDELYVTYGNDMHRGYYIFLIKLSDYE